LHKYFILLYPAPLEIFAKTKAFLTRQTSPFTMHTRNSIAPATALATGLFIFASLATAFEGRITATSTQGGQTTALLYTVGTNALRLEVIGSDRPNPVDILDRTSGELTLLFPHNRSFVRLKPAPENPAPPPGFPEMPAGIPPGVGPRTQAAPAAPANVGPTNLPGMPAVPQPPAGMGAGMPGGMPAMPMMAIAGEAMELKATGRKTNLLGFACEQFEIKQRGEIMEIWATAGLLPFQNFVRNQPPRFGPRLIEERWAGLLTARKLFPLRATLKYENGSERFRFEVLSVTPQKLKPEDDSLFLPPEGYFEIQPLPF
jgi:hypothetical protein